MTIARISMLRRRRTPLFALTLVAILGFEAQTPNAQEAGSPDTRIQVGEVRDFSAQNLTGTERSPASDDDRVEAIVTDTMLQELAAECDAELHFQKNPFGASALLYGERRIILIDLVKMQNSPFRLRFAVAHECGHHALGHTTPAGALLREKNQAGKELSADCFGARLLRDKGMLDVAKAQQAAFAALGATRADPLYPFFDERAAEIERCLS